jgi:2-polyprenyl-3-methyl-5-hydroxy-6-metoxy-1,4-benzoquinol methylase
MEKEKLVRNGRSTRNEIRLFTEKFYNKTNYPGSYTYKEITDISKSYPLKKYIHGKVLDAGCGTGIFTMAFSKMRNVKNVVGVDFSNSLNVASKFKLDNKIDNVEFKRADLNNLDNIGGQFDTVFCSGVLHHMVNSEEIFKKLVKKLKSKGNIIIGVYHPLGRFFMNIKKQFIKLHKYFYFLDKRYRNNYSRKNEWIMDQYFNPYEKSFSRKEIKKWFEKNNIKFLGTYPKSYSKGGLYLMIGEIK